MPIRSVIDNFINVLGLGPSSDKYEKYREILDNVPTSLLCSKLAKQRFRICFDRKKLIKSLQLKGAKENTLIMFLPNSGYDLWDRLRFCGSGITQTMFEGMLIHGDIQSKNKILPDLYTQDFLDLFEYLWERDGALRRLELDLLQIGRIYNRDKLIFSLSDDIINVIIDTETKLISVIGRDRSRVNQSESDLLTYSIGKSLVYKAKNDLSVSPDLCKQLKQWIKLDPTLGTTILITSIRSDFTYDTVILKERFINRIRSNKKLTGKFNDLVRAEKV